MTTNTSLDIEWSDLMKQAQDGDAAAYEQLLGHITEFLTAYLRKRLFNQDHVEDVQQDILLAIHKARHTYETSKPFFPWMYAIVKYKMIDYFKKQKKERATSLDNDAIQVESKGSFEHDLENKLILQGLINELPDRYKELIKTVKLDGYSVKESAVLLGLSVSNVKTSVHRAIKQLQKKAS